MVAQMGIQLFTVLRGLDLPGVGVADGGNHIGVGQAALHHVGVILTLPQGAQLEYMVGKTGPVPQGGDIVNALEAQVVDGEHGFRPSYRGGCEQGALENRHQGSLPVVAVDHIGSPVHEIQGSQSGLGEEAVFGNIRDDGSIGISVAEEFLVVDEIIHNAVPNVLHNAYVEGTPVGAQGHLELAPVDHPALVFPGNAPVAGKDDLHITVHPGQGLGQSVHHVAQTAGFDEGIALGTDEGNASSGAGDAAGFFRGHFRGRCIHSGNLRDGGFPSSVRNRSGSLLCLLLQGGLFGCLGLSGGRSAAFSR